MTWPELFEALMLVCFGAAWPVSIRKSIKSRTAKGKSLGFMTVVLVGYFFGIAHKITGNCDAVVFLYALNCFMVALDILLFFHNRRLDRQSACLGSPGENYTG